MSHSLGKGVVVWVGDGVPEYPGRLSIVTGLSLTVFAVLRLVTTRTDGRTDGRTYTSKRRQFHRPPKTEFCTEIDHWFIQQTIATANRSKEQATIGFCYSSGARIFSGGAKPLPFPFLLPFPPLLPFTVLEVGPFPSFPFPPFSSLRSRGPLSSPPFPSLRSRIP